MVAGIEKQVVRVERPLAPLFRQLLPKSKTGCAMRWSSDEGAVRFGSCRRDLPFDVALGFAPSRAKLREVYHLTFAKDIPYDVACIELAEGPRIITNVVGARNEELHIGTPVEVVFEDVSDEICLPKFRKGGAASRAAGDSTRP